MSRRLAALLGAAVNGNACAQSSKSSKLHFFLREFLFLPTGYQQVYSASQGFHPKTFSMAYLDVRFPRLGKHGMLPLPQADRCKMAVPATDHALGDMSESTSSIPSSKA